MQMHIMLFIILRQERYLLFMETCTLWPFSRPADRMLLYRKFWASIKQWP